MPIIDVSGLMSDEGEVKSQIREEIKMFFCKFGFSKKDTDVTFITDDTKEPGGDVIARLYSKSFLKMEEGTHNKICDDVVTILEKANHSFNEALIIPMLAIRGR